MVGHQAVADQTQVVLLDVLPQQIEIDCAVGIAVQDVLSRVEGLRVSWTDGTLTLWEQMGAKVRI